MGYHTRDDIPFQFALAEAFTVCDNYFCSVFGPTWPNRLYWMTGTIDPAGGQGRPGPGEQARPSRTAGRPTPSGSRRRASAGRSTRRRTTTAATSWRSSSQFQDARPGDPLYDRGMVHSPAGTFEDDARNDRLPTVSLDHPDRRSLRAPGLPPGSRRRLCRHQDRGHRVQSGRWRKTVFILNYDENDGLFDHVPPPTPPAGTADEFVGRPADRRRLPGALPHRLAVDGGRLGRARGVRPHLGAPVPGGRLGVEEPNISAWRRRTFGDLTSAFGFARRAGGTTRPTRTWATARRPSA